MQQQGEDVPSSSSLGGLASALARPAGNPMAGGGGSLALAANMAVGAAAAPTNVSDKPPQQRGVPPPRYDEHVKFRLIKVVVLGAPGVGKTALVRVRFDLPIYLRLYVCTYIR